MPVKKKRGRPRLHGKPGTGKNKKSDAQRIRDIAAAIPGSHGNYLAISKKVGLERHLVSKIVRGNKRLTQMIEQSREEAADEYGQRFHDWMMAGGKDNPPTTGQVRLYEMWVRSHRNLYPDWQLDKNELPPAEEDLSIIAEALRNQTKINLEIKVEKNEN